jgi:hypothetical protein
MPKWIWKLNMGALGALISLSVGGCVGGVEVGPQAIAGKKPDAFVEMHEVQAAYIGSGSTGEGFIDFGGRQYVFSVGGVGVGGVGLSTIDAKGEAYDLDDISEFPGTYAQARYGFALGDESGGDLWLQNEAGVILHLKAKRTGLMLSLGGDAILITMKP